MHDINSDILASACIKPENIIFGDTNLQLISQILFSLYSTAWSLHTRVTIQFQ